MAAQCSTLPHSFNLAFVLAEYKKITTSTRLSYHVSYNPHVSIPPSQTSLSGTLMAPAPTRPRAPTVTCTWSRSACSGTRSPSTRTNWCSARSSNTTDSLQVKCLTAFTMPCWKVSDGRVTVCLWFLLFRNQPQGELQEGDGAGEGALHLVRHGAGVHSPGDRWASIQLACQWIPSTPRWQMQLLRLEAVLLKRLYYFCRLLGTNIIDIDFKEILHWVCSSILDKLAKLSKRELAKYPVFYLSY